MDLTQPIHGLWGFERHDGIDKIGLITYDTNVCPNPLPPDVIDPEEPETPVDPEPPTTEIPLVVR